MRRSKRRPKSEILRKITIHSCAWLRRQAISFFSIFRNDQRRDEAREEEQSHFGGNVNGKQVQVA